MDGYCDNHTQLAINIATITQKQLSIEQSQERIEKFFTKHVDEGEKTGGFRDRLVVVELAVVSLTKEIAALKTAKWISAMVGGAIGGLVAIALPETLIMLIKVLFRG